MTTNDLIELSNAKPMYFSYGQFFAYDQNETQPGSLWTDEHVAQGFVRRKRALAIGTLTEYGVATLHVFRGHTVLLDEYDRVISVPIELESGILCIDGPEEYPIQRSIKVPPGQYQLLAAQSRVSETELRIDLFLDHWIKTDLKSRVLKADESLQVSSTLLETGDVAP